MTTMVATHRQSRPHRRSLAILGVALAVILAASACDNHAVQLYDSSVSVNESRARMGRTELTLRHDLSALAQTHAAAMAGSGRIYHSNVTRGLPAGWRTVGENVGRGGTTYSVHAALMRSPSHYQTMMSRSYSSFGVGVAEGRDGMVYVVQLFMG